MWPMNLQHEQVIRMEGPKPGDCEQQARRTWKHGMVGGSLATLSWWAMPRCKRIQCSLSGSRVEDLSTRKLTGAHINLIYWALTIYLVQSDQQTDVLPEQMTRWNWKCKRFIWVKCPSGKKEARESLGHCWCEPCEEQRRKNWLASSDYCAALWKFQTVHGGSLQAII